MHEISLIEFYERMKLSILWISHVLVWMYGDLIRLIHPGFIEKIIDTPVANDILLFVAVPLVLIQIFMILSSFLFSTRISQRVNIIAGSLYLVINTAHVVDISLNQSPAWEFLLAAAYLLLNVIVIKSAWVWKNMDK